MMWFFSSKKMNLNVFISSFLYDYVTFSLGWKHEKWEFLLLRLWKNFSLVTFLPSETSYITNTQEFIRIFFISSYFSLENIK